MVLGKKSRIRIKNQKEDSIVQIGGLKPINSQNFLLRKKKERQLEIQFGTIFFEWNKRECLEYSHSKTYLITQILL